MQSIRDGRVVYLSMVQEAETRYKGRQEVTHYNNRSVCAAERETRDGFGAIGSNVDTVH